MICNRCGEMRAMRKKLWGWLLCGVLLAAACGACAEEPAMVDITIHSKVYAPTGGERINYLFDCDASTYWKTDKRGVEYIQFYKPEGAATLSLLWMESP